MPSCKLCGFDLPLRRSHIIPEFLYAELYNAKRQMMAVRSTPSPGLDWPQKGISEPLFCEGCEQHFNEHFEKPFKAMWVDAKPLPLQFMPGELCELSFDYRAFKLFHLSVLFRAGVSSDMMFQEAILGEHEEVLRDLVFRKDVGNPWQYPFFGYAVVHHETRKTIPMILPAEISEYEGHRCMALMYGGVQWWFSLSFNRNREFERLGLRRDGKITFGSIPWNEITSVQNAAEAVRRARS
jgi:hypothetical protein